MKVDGNDKGVLDSRVEFLLAGLGKELAENRRRYFDAFEAKEQVLPLFYCDGLKGEVGYVRRINKKRILLVAAIIAMLFLLAATAYGIKRGLLKTDVIERDDHSEITWEEKDAVEGSWDFKKVEFGWLPEGYLFYSKDVGPEWYTLTYENEKGEFIIADIYADGNMTIYLNNEEVSREIIEINGCEATINEDETSNHKTIIWQEDGRVIVISGTNITRKDIIEVSKNLLLN